MIIDEIIIENNRIITIIVKNYPKNSFKLMIVNIMQITIIHKLGTALL